MTDLSRVHFTVPQFRRLRGTPVQLPNLVRARRKAACGVFARSAACGPPLQVDVYGATVDDADYNAVLLPDAAAAHDANVQLRLGDVFLDRDGAPCFCIRKLDLSRRGQGSLRRVRLGPCFAKLDRV